MKKKLFSELLIVNSFEYRFGLGRVVFFFSFVFNLKKQFALKIETEINDDEDFYFYFILR